MKERTGRRFGSEGRPKRYGQRDGVESLITKVTLDVYENNDCVPCSADAAIDGGRRS